METEVYLTRQDPSLRQCKDSPKTFQQIIAGCEMQAGKAYMERQNQVYMNICAENGLEVSQSKWEILPRVGQWQILWDLQI